jgi:hypothetical protein
MRPDIVEVAKIAGVVILSALIVAMIVGFFEGGEAAVRAFRLVLAIGGVVGLLQVAEARYAPYIMGGATLAGGLWLWTRRRA